MPILASSMFPNAYGKVGGVAVTTAETLNSIDNTQDIFVVKYSSLGKSVWAARIASRLVDSSFGIVTDSSGNVYVTGEGGSGAPTTIFNSDGSSFITLQNSGQNDGFVVKYNANGIAQWGVRIAGSLTDSGYSIDTDNSGNVYVTGRGSSSTIFNSDGTTFGTMLNSGSTDVFIIKYDTNGFAQWVARLGSTAADIGYGIATDSSGNVFVTGQGGSNIGIFSADGSTIGTLSSSGSNDAVVVKYNTDGVAQWAARVASASNEIGFGITTDSSGNVYVTGQGFASTVFNSDGTTFGTLSNSGGSDAFVVKYNTNGFAQWSARVASAQTEIGYGITTDSSGNVYVTGQGGSATVTAFNASGTAFGTTLTNSGLGDAFIVKYNTSGVVQWVAKVASQAVDTGYGIATDSSDNAYVICQGGPGALPNKISAFNANGTIFGTASVNSTGTDVVIAKYNASGVVQWLTSIASSGNDAARAITIDQTNNIYATGFFIGSSFSIYGQSSSLFSTLPNGGGNDVFVVKYNTNGSPQWVSRVASTGSDLGLGISTDTSGNIYVTGESGSGASTIIYNADGTTFGSLASSGSTDVFIVKYNADGVVQWSAKVASTQTETGYNTTTDSSGNVYITGRYSGLLSAFNANGSAFGTTVGQSGSGDAFIVKYDTNGVVQWLTRIGSAAADFGISNTTDSSGNLYITGRYDNTATAFNANGTAFGRTLTQSGGDAFIVKYDTNGAVQWVANIRSSLLDVGYGIATDSSGNVYVTGLGGSATVTAFSADGTAFGTTLANSGSGDAFIVKYSTNGVVQWVAKVASTAADIGYGIATDSSGNVYVAGQGGSATVTAFNADGTAFGSTLTNSGLGDAFIVKYNTSGVVQWTTRIGSSVAETSYAIDTDNLGNTYVTVDNSTNLTIFNSDGSNFALGNITNGLFVIKFDTNGFGRWAQVIRSASSPTLRGISVDSLGNPYVIGNSGSGSTVEIYNTDTSPYKILNSSGSTDVFVVKYSSNTTPLWAAKLSSQFTDIGYAISTDTSGNAYVTGVTGGNVIVFNSDGSIFRTLVSSGANDTFIVKYNTNGVVQWATNLGSTANDIGYGIATDSSGNVYVTGEGGSSTVTAFNADGTAFGTTIASPGYIFVFVVKYNTNGFVQWVTRIITTDGVGNSGFAIDTDTSGNVYVTGRGGVDAIATAFNSDGTTFGTLTTSGSNDVFIVKYDTNGFVQWFTRISSISSDIGYAIATDNSGNVYITNASGAGIIAFNANGTQFAPTSAYTSSGDDTFIVKYNTNGVVQWIARISSTTTDTGYGIATDSSGNVYVTGQGGSATLTAFNADGTAFGTTLTNSGQGDAFIVKYNTSGVVQWVAKIGSTVSDIGYAVATDSAGDVYITGTSNTSIITATNSNGTILGSTLINTAGKTIETFVAKYNSSGIAQWISIMSGVGTDRGRGISLDSSNNIYVTGEFATSALIPFDA